MYLNQGPVIYQKTHLTIHSWLHKLDLEIFMFIRGNSKRIVQILFVDREKNQETDFRQESMSANQRISVQCTSHMILCTSQILLCPNYFFDYLKASINSSPISTYLLISMKPFTSLKTRKILVMIFIQYLHYLMPENFYFVLFVVLIPFFIVVIISLV